MLPPERVQVVARDTGDRLQAPRSNQALDLAESLRSLSGPLNETLLRYGAQEKDKQEAAARADALKSSGKPFADAVREGRITATQNPWYVAAYNKESAQISSRTQLAELQTQAQTWEERNDPRAFQERWNKEVATLGENYKQIDQRAGFEGEAAAASQHVIESNTRLNAQRIEQERGDNLSKLVADAVRQTNADNGGNASPEQIYAALAGIREQAIGTGGTPEEWDRIVQAGVVSAAYNSQDADLIDVLKFDAEGRGSIYNLAGVADSVESDKYRIRANADAELDAQVNRDRLTAAADGNKAIDDAYKVFGTDILRGDVDPEAIIKSLEESGHGGRAISYALNDIQRTVADSASLSRAKMTGDPAVLDLYMRARTGGYSPQLRKDITSAIVSGDIDSSDGIRFLDVALEQSKRAETEVDQEEQRAAAKVGREVPKLRNDLSNISSYVAVQLKGAGTLLSDDQRTIYEQAIVDAAGAYLASNPEDYAGALTAAQQAGADILLDEAAKRRKRAEAKATTPSGQTQQPTQDNPRRS